MSFKDLTNQRFGKLVVLEKDESIERKNIYWKCICDCGNITVVLGSNLKCRHTLSCGCYADETRVSSNITHGLSKNRIYKIYNGMKNRCNNPNVKSYKHYGEKGIKICSEWLEDFTKFYEWSLQNGYCNELTIDRIDVNGDYEPSNCRWITLKVQENNRSNNRLITFNNKTQTLSQWAEEQNIDVRLLQQRIDKLNWNIEKALTKPVRHFKRKI